MDHSWFPGEDLEQVVGKLMVDYHDLFINYSGKSHPISIWDLDLGVHG